MRLAKWAKQGAWGVSLAILWFLPWPKGSFLPETPSWSHRDRTWALEGDHTARLETTQATQIVGGGFPRALEGRSIQADATEELSAHLLQSGEDVFDPRPNPGNAGVAARLAGGQRLAFLGLALDVYAPALGLETLLTLTINVALVAIKITTGICVIQDIFQVQGVILRSGADLDLADQLVASVGADRDLVTEVGYLSPSPRKGKN